MAQELIDWLIAHKEVPDRETAVQLMQHLMDCDIIHHGRTSLTATYVKVIFISVDFISVLHMLVTDVDQLENNLTMRDCVKS